MSQLHRRSRQCVVGVPRNCPARLLARFMLAVSRPVQYPVLEMPLLVRFDFGRPAIGTVFQVRAIVPSHRWYGERDMWSISGGKPAFAARGGCLRQGACWSPIRTSSPRITQIAACIYFNARSQRSASNVSRPLFVIGKGLSALFLRESGTAPIGEGPDRGK